MFTTFLTLHILGALYTGLLLVQSGFAIYKSKTEEYRNFAIRIIIILFIQILSGCILSLQSSHGMSITDFCSRIGIYVGSILGMESVLLWNMHKHNLSFPKLLVSSFGTLSILIAVTTAIYIY